MSIDVGQKAPEISLTNQDGKRVKLSDFTGKWVVVYFYPKASTPGCTIQACALRDHMDDFNNINADVLAISPDKTGALKKFEEKQNLQFHLLGDPEHTVAEAYGVWVEKSMFGKKYMGMARSTFIVNPQGNIAHIMHKVSPKKHAEQVLNWLKTNAEQSSVA